MKKVIFFLLACSLCISMQAQDSLSITKSHKAHKLLQIDLGLGGNIDFTHRTAGNLTSRLADRKKVIPVIDTRLSFYPFNRWGAYTNLRICMQGKGNKDIYPEVYQPLETDYFIQKTYYSNFENMDEVTAYFSIGPAYRIEKKKWGIHTRIGAGFNEAIIQRSQVILKKKGSNEMYEMKIDNADLNSYKTIFGLEFGINTYYELCKHCRLFMDISYFQPLDKTKTTYTKTDLYTNEIIDKQFYQSTTLGRNLNISLGIGIPFFIHKRTGKSSPRQKRSKAIMERTRKTYGLFPNNK